MLVDGDVVLEDGQLTRQREADVLALIGQCMERLQPEMQQEMLQTQTTEPALAEMYFRIRQQASDASA